MIVPVALILGGLMIYPFFYSIYLSLTSKTGGQLQFIGLSNYIRLIKSGTFWLVVRFSFIFTITAVSLKVIIGLVLALILNQLPSPGQKLFRAAILLPWVVPISLSTLIWWWIFQPNYSVLNWFFESMGLSSVPWLAKTFWARFAVITVDVWWGSPFYFVMFFAALQTVPQELYEVAEIDGAGPIAKFRHITIPVIKPILAVTTLYSLIVTFGHFDIVQILTGGGPEYYTHIFGTYSFSVGLASNQLGMGAAVSLFMFPVLAVISFFILRNARRGVT